MKTDRSQRTYVGRLEAASQAVYVVDSRGVDRLVEPVGGFGWGMDAAGPPTALAHALLADAAGSDPDHVAARRFAAQVLRRLPHDGFTLRRETVDAWLRGTVPV